MSKTILIADDSPTEMLLYRKKLSNAAVIKRFPLSMAKKPSKKRNNRTRK
jgi:hypothetical protein